MAHLDSHNHLVEDLLVEVFWDTAEAVPEVLVVAYLRPLKHFLWLWPVPVSVGNLKSNYSMVSPCLELLKLPEVVEAVEEDKNRLESKSHPLNMAKDNTSERMSEDLDNLGKEDQEALVVQEDPEYLVDLESPVLVRPEAPVDLEVPG